MSKRREEGEEGEHGRGRRGDKRGETVPALVY